MNEDIRYQFSVKFSKTDPRDTETLSFANAQSNFNDAVRYLIEKEIAENGIRDLSLLIPQRRGSLPHPVRRQRTKTVQQRSVQEQPVQPRSSQQPVSSQARLPHAVSSDGAKLPSGYED